MKDDKKKAAQLKRAEQDLIKTFREMCRFGPDLLGQTSTSPTKSPQKIPCNSQRRPVSPSKECLLPPFMLHPITEVTETVEGAKEVVEVVEVVKEVQTTRRGRIVRLPRKMGLF